MNEYIKPNVILPVSLHDAYLTGIQTENDTVTLIFEEGFTIVGDNTAKESGRATITFPKVDYDFCRVYLTGRHHFRKDWDIRDFAANITNELFKIQIVDETYGYNLAKFGCCNMTSKKWIAFEIEIYHFGEMNYQWEE